eukprot:GHVU01032405.1.p1 GENE.GHVU01032405.1~~GHVU01032405.1.p1  ORF type:complete len:1037 (+),score=136.68 GHVU01032405.1:5784-8894(+)
MVVQGEGMYVSSVNRLPPPPRTRFRPDTGLRTPSGAALEASTCPRCGYSAHSPGQTCPAKTGRCRFCNTVGHFDKVCRKKQQGMAAPPPRTDAARHPLAGGAAAAGAEVLDARCPPDDFFGWTAAGREECCFSPEDVPRSPLWFCDTACTDHVVARAHVEGCILRERPKVTQYRLAKRGLSFDSKHEAAVILTVTGADGKEKEVVLKINLAEDEDVPGLIKPTHLRLDATPEGSWATIRDYYGDLVRVRVDDPMGVSSGTIPSFRWTPKHVDSTTASCLFTRSRAHAQLSKEEVQDWHVRLLHPGALRLKGTLQEQGYEVSDSVCRTVTSDCTTCLQKNAVDRTPPRSESRRSSEKNFNHQVVWDLGHIHEAGYGGEHTFSLMVDEATLLWRAKALKQKSAAPTHLLEWIHEEGPMSALQSDNAPELKSATVQLICRDNNVHMVVTPPYTSAANGVVERAIRELRGLLRVAVAELKLPFSLWPALLPGLCALHNNSVSPLLKASPAQRRFQFPPRLTHVIGDTVVAKLPGPKSAPKTLALPGTPVTYLAELNSSSALVYRRDPHGGTVLRVHPSQLRPAARSVSSLPLPSAPSKPVRTSPSTPAVPPAASHPTRLRFCRPADDSSDSDMDGGPLGGPAPEAPEFDPPPQPAAVSADAPAAPVVPPLPSVPPPARDARQRTTPRLGNAPCAIASHWNHRRQPAVIRQDAGGSSVEVSWLAPIGNNQWTYDALERIPRSTFHSTFRLTSEGQIPAEHLADLQDSSDASAITSSDASSTPPSAQDATETPDSAFVAAASAPRDHAHAAWSCPPDFNDAAVLEYAALLHNDVIGPAVPVTKHAMTLGWLYKYKTDESTDALQPKARLYAKGFMDRRAHSTYAGTPALADYLVLLIFMLSQGWQRYHLDATSAFLQAPVSSTTSPPVIRLAGNLPTLPSTPPSSAFTQEEWDVIRERAARLQPGCYYRLNKALYGHPSAPFWWAIAVRKALLSLGWHEVAESSFVKLVAGLLIAALILHVDVVELGGKDALKEAEATRTVD